MLKPRSAGFISEILDQQGTAIRGSQEILNTFSSFYSQLYTATQTECHAELQQYLDSIALVWFSNSDREYMHQPFTLEDIKQVILSLPVDKAPGSDGLPPFSIKPMSKSWPPGSLPSMKKPSNRVSYHSPCARPLLLHYQNWVRMHGNWIPIDLYRS